MLQRSVSLPPSRPLIGRTLPESLETLLALGKSLGNGKWGEQQPLAPCVVFLCRHSLRSKRLDTWGVADVFGRLCIGSCPAASRLHVVRGPRAGNQRQRCPNYFPHTSYLFEGRYFTRHIAEGSAEFDVISHFHHLSPTFMHFHALSTFQIETST